MTGFHHLVDCICDSLCRSVCVCVCVHLYVVSICDSCVCVFVHLNYPIFCFDLQQSNKSWFGQNLSDVARNCSICICEVHHSKLMFRSPWRSMPRTTPRSLQWIAPFCYRYLSDIYSNAKLLVVGQCERTVALIKR